MRIFQQDVKAHVRFIRWGRILVVLLIMTSFLGGCTSDNANAQGDRTDPTGTNTPQNEALPANPAEEILILFTNKADDLAIEPGFFDVDGRPFFRVLGGLGNSDGMVTGSYMSVTGGEQSTFNAFFQYPLPDEVAQEPFDMPPTLPAQPWKPRSNWSKAKWTIEGRGDIYGVGEWLNLVSIQASNPPVVELQGGGFYFINGGTGEFVAAHGMATTVSSVDISEPPQPGRPDAAYLIHTLKILTNAVERPTNFDLFPAP